MFSLLQFLRKDRCKHAYILFIKVIDIACFYLGLLLNLPDLYTGDLQRACEYFADSLMLRLVIYKICVVGQLLNIYRDMHQYACLNGAVQRFFEHNFRISRNFTQTFYNHRIMYQFAKAGKPRVTLSPAQ